MRNLFAVAFLLVVVSSCVKDRTLPPYVPVSLGTRQLIHYWNFNDTTSPTTLITPSFTIGGGALSFDFTTVTGIAGYYDFLNPSSTNLNARNGDPAGSLLRVRNPSIDMIIAAPTTSHKNVILQYAVAASSTTSGALMDSIYYTTDGINYINSGLPTVSYSLTADPSYTVMSYDFTAITAVNNNANFKFKIVFLDGNLNTKGNTRIDNITVDADTMNIAPPPPPPPAQELLHYWNFNDVSILTPTSSIIPGAALSFDYSTVSGLSINANDSVPRIDANVFNAQNGDAPGNALRVRCPVTSFIISAPTTSYKDIILSYAVAKSSSGPAIDSVYYSIDGTNFINTGITPVTYPVDVDPIYAVMNYDFSAIPEVNNNPNFKFMILLVGGNTATSGNDRFDNLTVKGTHQ